jgi:tetratricopeptide (TPR) repeat protein
MARKQDDPALELAALMAQVPLLVVPTPLFDPQHGLTLGQQALMLARELDDQVAEAKLLWNLSTACIWNDLGSQAIEYGEGSLALARQLNLREQMALTLTDLGTFCYAFSGRLDQAKDALREAGAIWRELDNLPMLANNQASLGWICCFTGEYDKAETYSQEAIRLSEISNNIWGQSYSRYRLGYVYWDRGEPDKAIKTMEACIRYSDLAGINATDVVRADLAAVYGGLGAVERGLDVARSALAKADSRVLFVRPWILGVLAQLCLARDDLAEAQIAIDKATRSPGQETFVVNFASVRLAEGELFLRKGDYGQAVKVLEALFTDLDQFSMRSEMPSVLYLQGQALLDLGRTAAARHCFLEAHAEAQAIGSRRMLWRILTALASIEDDPAEGERLRRQAQETVEYIIRHISDPELRTSFLNLPEVQSVVEKT